MRTTRIVLSSARPSRSPAIGLPNWWRAIRADHRINLIERVRRRRRKMELNPVTATQIWFYRLILLGATFLFSALLLGA